MGAGYPTGRDGEDSISLILRTMVISPDTLGSVDFTFVGQPEVGQTNALDVLTTQLNNPAMTEFAAATAWVHAAGVRLLAPGLSRFRSRGGRSTLICGLSRGAATIAGLEEAARNFDRVFVAFDPSARTIHTKMYLFSGDSEAALLIGSQNLSKSGLVTNHEAGIWITGAVHSQVFSDARSYMQRMTQDQHIAQLLTEELMAQLVQSDQISFAVPSTTKDRQAWTGDAEMPIFHRSDRQMRGATVPRTRESAADPAATDLPGSLWGRSVVARWSKLIPQADAQRLVGSNTSNTLTLTRANNDIDKTTWFRHTLFGDQAWYSVQGSTRHERAAVVFEVEGLGTRFAEEMIVEHNLRHESSQSNRVTSIRWGQATRRLLRDTYNVTGQTVTVERFSDQTFRISFTPGETGPFTDKLRSAAGL